MNNVDNADLIILGGGPAGYHAALVAVNSGLRVSLFEAKRLGGTCLNEGCIPPSPFCIRLKYLNMAKIPPGMGLWPKRSK